ncbi:hypothetical protein LCGC14_0491650 [marine sediment metagenome]|uniref:Uncharacterized protein n=1 Tax=marine sediment metagenome TaxID=412755 RepID=A0A0F9SPS8_9ZZZZ
MPKESKKSKTTERIWNLKIFKQKTITKKDFEENKEDIVNMMENLVKIVNNPSLFVYEVHCETFKQYFKLSTKILRYLDEKEMKEVEKITNFYKDKCKSSWFAKPRVVVDEDFL